MEMPMETSQEEVGGGNNNNNKVEGTPSEKKEEKSALQDNIDRKGNNAYYFAHANPATGPEWDGKAEPRLLRTLNAQKVSITTTSEKCFDYQKSNITKYSFVDDRSKIKLFINLEGIGAQCSDHDITLEYTDCSFCLTIRNYSSPHTTNTEEEEKTNFGSNERCLSFGRLFGKIQNASYKIKPDRIVLIMVKREGESVWSTIGASAVDGNENGGIK